MEVQRKGKRQHKIEVSSSFFAVLVSQPANFPVNILVWNSWPLSCSSTHFPNLSKMMKLPFYEC